MEDATQLEWRLLDMAEARLDWIRDAGDSIRTKTSALASVSLTLLGLLLAATAIQPPTAASASYAVAIAASAFAVAIIIGAAETRPVDMKRAGTPGEWAVYGASIAQQTAVRELIEDMESAAAIQGTRNHHAEKPLLAVQALLAVGLLAWLIALGLSL